VTDVSWEIPRTQVGNRIVVVAWAVFALAAVGTGVLIYQAVAGSDGGVSGPLPTTTVGTVSTGTSTPSTAPSSAVASSTLKPPLLPAAAAKPTREGAAAFLRYFFEVYTYTYASLDTDAMSGISLPGCNTCTSVMDNAREAASAGNTVEPGLIEVTAVIAAPGMPTEGIVVSAVIQQEPVVTRDRTGEVIGETTATTNARVDARVIWNGKAWGMRAARVIKAATP
jgi:hypothetical protein